jgi:hypothetical protein
MGTKYLRQRLRFHFMERLPPPYIDLLFRIEVSGASDLGPGESLMTSDSCTALISIPVTTRFAPLTHSVLLLIR